MANLSHLENCLVRRADSDANLRALGTLEHIAIDLQLARLCATHQESEGAKLPLGRCVAALILSCRALDINLNDCLALAMRDLKIPY